MPMKDRSGRYERLSAAISSVHRYIQQLERYEMEQCGYKGMYAQYLSVISRAEGGITLGGLCEKCDKDKAAVSRAVAEMIKAGLIERTDGTQYRACVRLTDAGREAAAFVKQRVETAVGEIGKGVTKTELASFYKTLDTITSNLHRLTKEGIPDE